MVSFPNVFVSQSNIVSASVYFITVTTTTVGYGNFAPTLPESRLFMSFYMIFGVTVAFSFASTFASTTLRNAHDGVIVQFHLWRGKDPPAENDMIRYVHRI